MPTQGVAEQCPGWGSAIRLMMARALRNRRANVAHEELRAYLRLATIDHLLLQSAR